MKLRKFGFKYKVMGGPAQIILFSEDLEAARLIAEDLIELSRSIERKYSRYLPDSVLTTINNSAGLEAVQVDNETADLLDYADACFRQSSGLFDITSGVLRQIWDFKNEKLPTILQLKNILPQIGWDKVEWKRPFIKLPAGMEIDFGGLGKEYAVDRIAARCQELNVKSALINLAGDIRAIGPQVDGKPWIVGIAHPRKDNALLTRIEIYKGAVATSGDYERYFIKNGRRYCHILNPKTGYPVCDQQAVTVASDSCLVAGSLASIAMLQGPLRAEIMFKTYQVPFIQVRNDGQIQSKFEVKYEKQYENKFPKQFPKQTTKQFA